jgi:hypothetical protein
MTAMNTYDVYNVLPELITNLVKFFSADVFKVGRRIDLCQKRSGGDGRLEGGIG